MYESAYNTLCRERLFVKLRWMQKQELMEKDPRQTAVWVKELVEDMYDQYLCIHEARMNLFGNDITDHKCEIDLGEETEEDFLDLEWDIDEDEEMDSDAEEMFERCHSQ
jgi:hypothetical protein